MAVKKRIVYGFLLLFPVSCLKYSAFLISWITMLCSVFLFISGEPSFYNQFVKLLFVTHSFPLSCQLSLLNANKQVQGNYVYFLKTFLLRRINLQFFQCKIYSLLKVNYFKWDLLDFYIARLLIYRAFKLRRLKLVLTCLADCFESNSVVFKVSQLF